MPVHSMIEFSPLDTLFFGDGRPFHQMDAGLATAASRFPPLPSTTSGALMAALGEALGHDVGKPDDWEKSAKLLEKAGKPLDAAKLRALAELTADKWDWQQQPKPPVQFSGPFVQARNADSADLDTYLPAPLTLYQRKARSGRSQDHKFGTLLPKKIAGEADGGLTHVPWLKCTDESADERKAYKPLAGSWLRLDKFKEYLIDLDGFIRKINNKNNNGTYQDFADALLHPGRDLSTAQEHVGIALDHGSRTVSSGQLYAASHTRLSEKKQVSLIAGLEWENGQSPALPCLLPLGGEGRGVVVALKRNWHLPDKFRLRGGSENNNKFQKWIRSKKIYYRIVALTPIPCGNGPFGLPDLPKALNGDNVISAVCPRPELVGLWSFADRTTKLFHVFPAGSTWFVEKTPSTSNVNGSTALSLYNKAGLERLGPRELTWMGYGQFAIGNWPQ